MTLRVVFFRLNDINSQTGSSPLYSIIFPDWTVPFSLSSLERDPAVADSSARYYTLAPRPMVPPSIVMVCPVI